MSHTLKTEMTLRRPIDEVFAFFADADNLQRITPPELHFQITTPTPLELGEGSIIDYRLRLFGIPLRWRSKITRWSPPHQFVDEQVRGPYAEWIHTHRFFQRDGVAVIEDEVHYRLPLWPLGEVVYPLIRFQLSRIFHYRQQAIRAALLDNFQPTA